MTNSNWTRAALCGPVTEENDPWFSTDSDEQMEARLVCMSCPVRAQCLIHSLVNGFEFGIFAGLDEEERKPLSELLLQELPQMVLRPVEMAYLLPKLEEPEPEELTGHEASVATKLRVRAERAEKAYGILMGMPHNDIPHYQVYIDCLRAILDNPTYPAEKLGKAVNRSTAMFNQRVRECFEFCGV